MVGIDEKFYYFQQTIEQRGEVKSSALIRAGIRNRQQDEIFRLAKRARLPIKLVPSEALDRLAQSTKHQGVLGLSLIHI